MNRLFCILWIGLLFSFAGCSGGMKTHYVEGTVKHDGVPLAGAIVSFTPKTEGQGNVATGATDANGVYKLTVVQGGTKDKGTTAGDYIVAVSKKTDFPIEMAPPTPGFSGDVPIYGYVFPKKYANPNTSGLTATIKSGKNLNIDFELTGPGDKPMK